MINYAALGFDYLIAIDYEILYRIIKTVYDTFIKMSVSVNHKMRTTYLLFFLANLRIYEYILSCIQLTQ